MNIKITTAEPEDAEEILKVQYAAFQSEAMLHNDFTIQPLTQTLDELLAEFQTRLILKAVLNGRIVGSVRQGTVLCLKTQNRPLLFRGYPKDCFLKLF